MDTMTLYGNEHITQNLDQEGESWHMKCCKNFQRSLEQWHEKAGQATNVYPFVYLRSPIKWFESVWKHAICQMLHLQF